ncbi:YcbK family protein [Microvirga sp. 2TAF3]|uniref:YcbK family protein n=1 Tax=Microvirga sp. 2TAF3 TaxID=3233014 RepID=UPI003F99B755
MSASFRLRQASWSAFMASAFVFGAFSVSVRAESEGVALPPARYASLPSNDRLKSPSVTGALPNVGRVGPRNLSGFYAFVELGSIVLRESTPTKCLPDKLREVVADLSAKFGTVSIQSTHRTAWRNRRAGGVRHSLHLSCRAIDFRVHTRGQGVMAYLRSRPEIGGLKIYRNGIIHIDNGTRRSW